ncbi:MAG: hypothetical protein WCF99_17690 [Chloroflexales bacterium]
MVDSIMAVLRYGLVLTVVVEAALIGKALFTLAMEKARPATPVPSQE